MGIKNKIRSGVGLIALGALFLGVPGLANDLSKVEVGRVVAPQGGVSIQPHDPPREEDAVTGEMSLFWGDTIKTGEKSIAQLILYPKLSLTMSPETEVRIIGNLIIQDEGKVYADGAVRVIKGVVHGRLDHDPSSNQNVRVVAPRSVSSIRGTEFYVSASEKDVQILVKNGKVEVHASGQSDKHSIDAGEGLAVDQSGLGKKLSKAETKTFIQKLGAEVPSLSSNRVGSSWEQRSSNTLLIHEKNRKKMESEFTKKMQEVEKEFLKEIQKKQEARKEDEA
jgi:hypothetical protein